MASLLLAVALLVASVEQWLQASSSAAVAAAGVAGFTAVTIVIVSWSLSAWLLLPFAIGLCLALIPAVGTRISSEALELAFRTLAAGVIVAGLWSCVGLLDVLGFDASAGVGVGGNLSAAGLRLALFVLTLGFLRFVRRDRPAGRQEEPLRWGLSGGMVLLIAAAAHGWPVPGLLFAALGAWLAVLWARRGGWMEGPVGVVTGCVLSALLAAVVWELAYHQILEERLRQFVDIELAPPSAAELTDAAATAEAFFDNLALEELSAADPVALDAQDLAFALWRQSPLAGVGGLSMVSVGPEDAPLSTFAFGLPTAASGRVPENSQLWSGLRLPGWEEATVEGQGLLSLGGGPWTTVEYRLLLRPGFRTGGSLLPTLAAGLLRQQSDLVPPRTDLPGDLLLGLYRGDGVVVVPPWKGAADLSGLPEEATTEIPGGRARVFLAGDSTGFRVAYLPVPPPLQALERVAIHAALPLVILLCLTLLWLLVGLFEPGRRAALRSGWRSFSKRLVVLYTVLLIVPIILINVLVLRVFAERLEREQRAAGQAALESAQSILGDYVFSLEPGFGIDTAVGDDVLLWLSGVVHHEVNLYWGSRLSASSKRELFSSGLLPPRIPGEIFSRIALEGADLASRTTRVAGAVYEEFYAPLEIPGVRTADAGLFVSTPLLAQEVASAQEMAAIRNRVLLAGAAVALLLLLLGRRVGRSFTRPLLQIVEGTQAIAAGSPSIEVKASDSEFVTLVEAIDEMAGRIAAARSELLREKQVVDRMIDNITSGVVSIDRRGRVLLLNRTAHDLLGIRSGEPIVGALDRDNRLRPVASFVSRVGSEPAQSTVKLAREGGEEAEWTLVWVPLSGSGEPAALFVLEDVTEVLRGQRLQAWAEMARMIAHEVKNPLTPIRLSTEHLREVHRSQRDDLDEVLERCTDNILRQVDELQQIASDFSAYSRIPEIKARPGDVADLVESVVEGYRAGGPSVSFNRQAGPWTADFDEKLLGRAVRNLLENAIRATRDGGAVDVVVEGRENVLEIRVVDNGGGIAREHLPRIFEPYFSTAASGTGLGLPIARRIVEEHGGDIAARNISPPGLEVVITLPRSLAGGAVIDEPAAD
jgi:nitrogen fixation/metabolism regulation signal transduction histidine kinase